MILILAGQSGVGKDSIREKLVSDYGFIPIVSSTTRPKRPGEVDGREYNFLWEEEFLQRVIVRRIFETRSVNILGEKYLYGSEAVNDPEHKKYVVILDDDGITGYKWFYHDTCYVACIKADEMTRKAWAWQRLHADDSPAVPKGDEWESFCKKWESRAENDRRQFLSDKFIRDVDIIVKNCPEKTPKDVAEEIVDKLGTVIENSKDVTSTKKRAKDMRDFAAIYKKTRFEGTAADCVNEAVRTYGVKWVRDTLNVYVTLKSSDGRIDYHHKRWFKKVPIYAPIENSLNDCIYEADNIHSAHLDNLVSAFLNVLRS